MNRKKELKAQYKQMKPVIKTDYTDDLAELCAIWREKLLKEGITFY